MKKYIKPTVKEISLDSSSLLAGSVINFNNNPVDPSTGGDAKEFDGMSDDWDSDYEEE